MNKSDKVKITHVDANKSFTGRLLGFITEEECMAALNTEGAAKKIFTSTGVSIDDVPTLVNGTRFVIATVDISKDKKQTIFFSPHIDYSYVSNGNLIVRCSDHNYYKLEATK